MHLLLGRSVCHAGDDGGEVRNTGQEDALVQKLIVVVQAHGRVGHGREPNGGDTCVCTWTKMCQLWVQLTEIAQEAAVCARWEDLLAQLDASTVYIIKR